MSDTPLSYRSAGVDVAQGEAAAQAYATLAASTHGPGVLGGLGLFGGLFRLPALKRPVLVAGCDGVGTKLKIAFASGRLNTVGIDLVAMSVNDVLCHGAEPLFFLDYLATAKLEPAAAIEVVRGIAHGCQLAGCALLGGETAEMPGFYAPGEFDLAGFAVGVVEEERLIDGSRILPGDVVLGLPSTGLHSNGFSLARAVLERAKLSWNDPYPDGGSWIDVLLPPTRIYVAEVRCLLGQSRVHGLCHVTGGGIARNLARILPVGTAARLRRANWPQPRVFGHLQRLGQVSEPEMDLAFNQGLGFLAVLPAQEADRALRALQSEHLPATLVGEITTGDRTVVLV